MMKFRKFIVTILITIMVFASIGTNSIGASPIEKVENNPYIQAYLKENNSNKVEGSSEILVADPQKEKEIIFSTLQEYYNEDVKVADILKKFYKDTKLINQIISIKREDKINVMHHIIKVYPDVKEAKDQEILKNYFARYARNSNDKVSIAFFDELIQKEPISPLSSYDGDSAASWAYYNYNQYSSNFPKLTQGPFSNCTNFVSQAMHIGGGTPMQASWYVYKKNSTYWEPTTVAEMNYSWDLADPSPWISVSQFTSFWSAIADYRFYSSTNYQLNHASIFDNQPINRGDIVILYKGVWGWVTTPTHAMIISQYDFSNKDYLLAGQSVERQAHPLRTAIQNYAEVRFILLH